jgi:hypothetical protein
MHFTESDIQKYIWSRRDDFASLLENKTLPAEVSFKDDLSDLSAQSLIRNRTISRLSSAYEKLLSMELIGMEVPLEQQANSTIRADFLAAFPGNTGIGIVELKKSAQTERQAFTELLAYSNHLATIFPVMTREDAVFVLIAPFETRICRDALIQSLLFDNRIIVGLVPVLADPTRLDSLSLQLWVPRDRELADFASLAFRGENFSVCKVVWEYSEGWWDAKKGEDPTPGLIEQLNSVSAIAAQHMEVSGIHGFTYTSQVWSELSDVIPFTNSIVLVGMNPFAVGATQFLLRTDAASIHRVPPPQSYLPNIIELIPGLAASAKSIHEHVDYMSDLHSVWDSQLFRIGKKVVDAATQTTSGHSLRTDQGFFDWDTYQRQFLEDVTCKNFDMRPTGLLRELYTSVTALDYRLAGKVGVENHPIHGDMYFSAIEALTSQAYFREFILRMLGDEEEDA